MKEFQGKVAVVTGAASGIGRTDVSQAGEVETLARKAFETYSAVHLLFNNAGVGAGKSAWESSLADWEWVLGVNLWGVIHGIHFFVPRMLEQRSEGHIVNTASMAGLTYGPGQSIYKVSKHGVVSLSETLYYELALRGASLKVSVLCPGLVSTNILDARRNRPARLQDASVKEPLSPQAEAVVQRFQQAVREAMPPGQVADIVFEAIREERFYILTHPTWKAAIQIRMEDILQERNPTLPRAPH